MQYKKITNLQVCGGGDGIRTQKPVLDFINYYRALVILWVVSGHTMIWGRDTIYASNFYFFTGATYLFVFISGFLFQYLSHKYDYLTYIKKKLTNVIMPFIIITIPVALAYTFSDPNISTYCDGAPKLFRFLICFLQGSIINQPMWYMGMITVFFLLAPLFIKIQKNKMILIAVTFCSIIYTLKTNRLPVPFPELDTGIANIVLTNIIFYIKQFLYFASAYLIGMLSCYLIEEYGEIIKSKAKPIFYILLTCFSFDFIFHIYFLKLSFLNVSLQKIIESLLLLFFFIAFEREIKNNKIIDKTLNFLADYSFGIFFVHSLFLNIIYCKTIYMPLAFGVPEFVHYNTLKAFLFCTGLYFSVLFLSVFYLWLMKKILNLLRIKNTRMFIGV